MTHRLLLITYAIAAMLFGIGPTSRADDSHSVTLYSFEDGTDGWWTYANAATIFFYAAGCFFNMEEL